VAAAPFEGLFVGVKPSPLSAVWKVQLSLLCEGCGLPCLLAVWRVRPPLSPCCVKGVASLAALLCKVQPTLLSAVWSFWSRLQSSCYDILWSALLLNLSNCCSLPKQGFAHSPCFSELRVSWLRICCEGYGSPLSCVLIPVTRELSGMKDPSFFGKRSTVDLWTESYLSISKWF
jgi:hypothetical protein